MIHIYEYINKQLEPSEIEVDGVKVSKDIMTKCFECDLKKCKGCCCVTGAQGAILQENEVDIIQDIMPEVEQYISKEALQKVIEAGHTYNEDNIDFVQTVKRDGKEACIFAIEENGCTLCAIDKAFREGNEKLRELNFPKPLTCHLYPIEQENNCLVYDVDKRCKCVANCQTPLYVMQKYPLVRAYGEDWYDNLVSQIS